MSLSARRAAADKENAGVGHWSRRSVAEVKALEAFVDRHCRPIIGNITHAHSPRTHRLTLLSAQISVHEERVPR